MGRHSTFTQDKADEIALRLSDGEPLRQICRDESMPSWVTVYNWMDERPEFHSLIARARARGEDSIAAECMEIADDSRNDYIDKLNAEGEVIGQQLNSEHVQRSKLRIETRLKLLAKWNPKKYGDKIQAEHTGADGGPLQMLLGQLGKTSIPVVADPDD